MTMLVIDVSRNSIRQSFSDKGIVGTVHHVLWFRIFRPVLVISIWGLLGLYVGYSISSVGPSGLPFEQLRMYGNIIAGMGGVLVVWMVLSRLDRAIRRKIARAPVAAATSSSTTSATASRATLHAEKSPAWHRPRNTRLLVVDHDDDGDITHVRSWQEWSGRPAPAGTGTPPTPFMRSPEYDPEEPVLAASPASQVSAPIVLENLDRPEPSLTRAHEPAPAQEPRDVVRAVDVVTADAAGFHRFGYRGRLGRSDWVEPQSVSQTYAMRPGMARHYGSVTAVVHGRAAAQAADRATERHRALHAFGAHAQLDDPYARHERVEPIDPLHGFGRRANIVAEDV